VGVDLAGDVDFVLDRDRHPQQRPLVPGSHPRLGLLSFQQRLLGENLAKRVQLGIKPSDPVKAELDQLGRRHLPTPNHLRLPHRTSKSNLISTHRRILLAVQPGCVS
jgi:hypothetical protein